LRTPSSQEFGQVTIVSEERHGLSDHSAMSVHQVRIELPVDLDADCVVVLAEHWAEACIAERHVDVIEQ
jgi:hypothetical protein